MIIKSLASFNELFCSILAQCSLCELYLKSNRLLTFDIRLNFFHSFEMNNYIKVGFMK